MTQATRILVNGTERYPVLVGRDLLDDVAELIGNQVHRVVVVHQRAVEPIARRIRRRLAGEGLRTQLAYIPDAEEAKGVQTASQLWSLLGRSDFTRSDAIVTVGGGAATDLGGFVAATWLRGIRVLHVPTTLLGMVDAAVGGKTGINTPEGKNLVGAFHPPSAVLCDLATLETLPQADLIAGMAEVVKAGFIARPQILETIEAEPSEAVRWDSPVLAGLVADSIQVKADVVGADLRETYLREILNYGHTLGHAIEQVDQYQHRHGEAVAVGMVFAAELARRTGPADDALVARHRDVLRSLGLPTTYPQDRWPQLLTAMRRDKKNRGELMRFVVLAALAAPVRLEGPDPQILEDAYHALAA